jgi:MFS family permease
VRELQRRSGFRLLLAGQGVSALGDWMGTIAFMVLVHRLTDSSTAVAGILVLRLLPAAVAGPLVARAARRWDRRQTMLSMDLVRAGLVALVPLVRGLWWIYLLAFLVEVASLVFLPARDASVPDLVGDGDPTVANGLILASSYGTIPLGAALFAAAAALPALDDGGLAGHPYAVVFWIDAATYIVSFFLVGRIVELSDGGHHGGDAAEASFGDAFRIPLVRAVLPAAATAAIGLGALFSLGIVFVRDVLGATDAEFGVLVALFGMGAVGGLAVLRSLTVSLRTVQAAVAVQGGLIAGMSLAPDIAVTFIGAAGFGAATAASLAAGMSVLQARLGGRDLVLAFAAFHIVIRAGLSAAAIGAGVAADLVDTVRPVLFSSGLVVVASAALVTERSARETAR